MSMNLFSNIDQLSRGLNASWKRDAVIRNNIANNDTPNFDRSYVAFEDLYKQELESASGNGDAFVAKKTRDKHMDFGDLVSAGDGVVVTDTSTTMRMDGNNVDIDQEMVELARNVIYYNALQTKVNGEISQLRTVIREGK